MVVVELRVEERRGSRGGCRHDTAQGACPCSPDPKKMSRMASIRTADRPTPIHILLFYKTAGCV